MLDLGCITSLHNSLKCPFSGGMGECVGHPTVATGCVLHAVPREIGNATSLLIVQMSSVGILSPISADAQCRMHMGSVCVLPSRMAWLQRCCLVPRPLFQTLVSVHCGWPGLAVVGVMTLSSSVPVLTRWGRKRGGFSLCSTPGCSALQTHLPDGNFQLKARWGGLKLTRKVTKLFLSFYLFKEESVMGGKGKNWVTLGERQLGNHWTGGNCCSTDFAGTDVLCSWWRLTYKTLGKLTDVSFHPETENKTWCTMRILRSAG